MQHVATVHAFDVMTEVRTTAVVRRYDGMRRDASDIVFECTTTFPGTGESDPIEWLKDALIALLETL